jgi:hypothetical protein
MSQHHDHLKDYLSGIKRVRPSELEQLSRFPNWRELAQRELERRVTDLMRMFGDGLIEAIARGEVDVNATIAEVLAAK